MSHSDYGCVQPRVRSVPFKTKENAWLGWRFCAMTSPKSTISDDAPSLQNDDTYLIRCTPDALELWAIDVATRKSGTDGDAIHSVIEQVSRSASTHAAPSEVIAEAHRSLTAYLERRNARGAAALVCVRLGRDGQVLWAHAGDPALIHWRPANIWSSESRMRLLNTRQREGNGLLQCVGMQRAVTPLVEEGAFRLKQNERLFLLTDGVFHDAMQLGKLKRWVDAYDRLGASSLPSDLARKIDTEARMSQPHADDRTLIVVELAPVET